jgi:RNA polymerase sigma-70 factor (ECF subfamily)
MLADHHAAEDGVQEVWARVLRTLPDYEIREVPFSVWLFRVARNWALNYLEKHGRVVPEDPHIVGARLEAALPPGVIDELPDEQLLRTLRQMPLAQRQVLALRHVAGLSVAEVATIIDRSEDAVHQLQRRGLKFLRTRLALPPRAPARSERRDRPLAMRRRLTERRVADARRLVLAGCLTNAESASVFTRLSGY